MLRIGCGFDVHAFAAEQRVAERRLILGGVDIPHSAGLDGHSDADVLTHALCDALLGALALGDIGAMFPDDSPQYKDADSLQLLRRIMERVAAEGAVVVNADATVALQRPKLSPYIGTMRQNLADCLGVTARQISVKATTTERLGFVGREEGAAAYAVVLLETGE